MKMTAVDLIPLLATFPKTVPSATRFDSEIDFPDMASLRKAPRYEPANNPANAPIKNKTPAPMIVPRIPPIMAQTADRIVVLGRGKVLAEGDLPDLVQEWTSTAVTVRSPRLTELISEIEGSEVTVTSNEPELATITGLTAARIGDLAAARGIPLHELTPHAGSLEDAYLALTGEAVEYRTKEIA